MTDSEASYNAAIAALRLIVVMRGAIPRPDEPIDILLMNVQSVPAAAASPGGSAGPAGAPTMAAHRGCDAVGPPAIIRATEDAA